MDYQIQIEHLALRREIHRIDEIYETEHRVSVEFDATDARVQFYHTRGQISRDMGASGAIVPSRLPLVHHTGGQLSRDMGVSGEIAPARLRMDGSLFRYEHQYESEASFEATQVSRLFPDQAETPHFGNITSENDNSLTTECARELR